MTAARREVHLRRISCAGFERDDRLYDIEGRLTDTRPEKVTLPEKVVAPNAPLHDMFVCLTIDRQFLIHNAFAQSMVTPYRSCGDIVEEYRQLIGIRIEAGFSLTVKRIFKGVRGCTHLTELLPPMATTAFQVIWGTAHMSGSDDQQRESGLGGCHALSLDGDIVLRYFPDQSKSRRFVRKDE